MTTTEITTLARSMRVTATTLARSIGKLQHELELQAREALEQLEQLRDSLRTHCQAGDAADRARIEPHKIGAEIGVESSASDDELRAIAACEMAIGDAVATMQRIIVATDATRLLLDLVDGCCSCRSTLPALVSLPCLRCRQPVTVRR